MVDVLLFYLVRAKIHHEIGTLLCEKAVEKAFPSLLRDNSSQFLVSFSGGKSTMSNAATGVNQSS
jgi:hypothetical protein